MSNIYFSLPALRNCKTNFYYILLFVCHISSKSDGVVLINSRTPFIKYLCCFIPVPRAPTVMLISHAAVRDHLIKPLTEAVN